MKNRLLIILCGSIMVGLLVTCSSVLVKQFYMLSYAPSPLTERLNPTPYPCVIRLKDFEIEEAYSRPQIVYRQSPFELRYYVYRVWAVKPTLMISDLIRKHLLSVNIVSRVIRRFDEGVKPDYELSGTIEAIEEYDSEKIWFAHLALMIRLTRLSDNKVVYSRHFDNRKQVAKNEPEIVIREMSSIFEYIMMQATHDIDLVLARDYGQTQVQLQGSFDTPDTTAPVMAK